MKNCITVFLLLVLANCKDIPQANEELFDIRRVEYVREVGDSVIYEPAIIKIPKQRHIFKKGRRFQYGITYVSSQNDTLTKTMLRIIATGKRAPIEPDLQDEVFYQYEKKDIQIEDFKAHPFASSYMINGTSITEGIIENEQQVWMHPMRHNQFAFTELCPFPEAQLPLKIGKMWEKQLSIHQFGDWSGLYTNSTYYVKEKRMHPIFADGKNYECWVIEANATFSEGVCTLDMLFHEDYGFVYLAYKNHIQEKLIMDLIEVKD